MTDYIRLFSNFHKLLINGAPNVVYNHIKCNGSEDSMNDEKLLYDIFKKAFEESNLFSFAIEVQKFSYLTNGLKEAPIGQHFVKSLIEECIKFRSPAGTDHYMQVFSRFTKSVLGESALFQSFSELHIKNTDFSLTPEKILKSSTACNVPDSFREKVKRVPRNLMFAVLGWSGTKPNISIEAYDSLSEKWFYFRQKNFLRRAYHGVVANGLLIYVIGGFDGRHCCSSTYCFNIEKRSWSRKPRMQEIRCYVTALGYQGLVYAIGGFNNDVRLKSCERFNPRTQQWKFLESMNVRRSDASGAVHKGKIYVCGGFNGRNILESAEVYDCKANQWTMISPLLGPRSGHCMVSIQGFLLVLGGFDGRSRLQTVALYDEKEDHWTIHVPMLSPRSNFAAVVMGNELFVMGGYNGEATFAEVEKFSTKTKSWQRVQNLKCHRSALGACVFNDFEVPSTCLKPDEFIVRSANVEQSSP